MTKKGKTRYKDERYCEGFDMEGKDGGGQWRAEEMFSSY